jgi:hypothetical protein
VTGLYLLVVIMVAAMLLPCSWSDPEENNKGGH